MSIAIFLTIDNKRNMDVPCKDRLVRHSVKQKLSLSNFAFHTQCKHTTYVIIYILCFYVWPAGYH